MSASDTASTADLPRVLIVDDEPLARRFLHRLLERDGGVGEVRQCANGLEANTEIARFAPDILFLDVEMPGLDGVSVLGGLGEGPAPVTVFTTAYSEHAVKAFELEACDYLLKPFDEARFAKALKRAKDEVELLRAAAGGTKLAIQSDGRTHLIDARRIVLIAAEDNYVRVRIENRSFLHRATLGAVEAALKPARFLRVHRRFLVNPAHVREFTGHDLVMGDGSRAPVSRRLKERAKALFPRV